MIDITNTGASSTTLLTPGQIVGGVNQNNIDGSLCINIYTFAADEQEVACCSCLVTPNALWSASVKTALLNSTLTPSFPNEVVIKLIVRPHCGDRRSAELQPGHLTERRDRRNATWRARLGHVGAWVPDRHWSYLRDGRDPVPSGNSDARPS